MGDGIVRSRGVPVTDGYSDEQTRVMDVCRSILEASPRSDSERTMVVLCDRSSLDIAAAVADCDSAAKVLVFVRGRRAPDDELKRLPANCSLGAGHDTSRRSRVLDVAKLTSPPVLMVEYDARPGRPQSSAFPAFLSTLAAGGHYVILDNDKSVPHPVPPHEPVTARELTRWYVESAGTVSEEHGPWATELSRSIGSVRVEGDFTILTKRGDHVFKLHLDEMEEVASARWGPTWADTLVRLEPYEYSMAGKLVLANVGPVRQDHRSISVPERVLRRHHDVTLSRRMLLRRENLALTESFHHPHQVALRHPRLMDVSLMMARDPTRGEARDLEGSYFLLDTNYPGHFGHVTTEVLAMMWGWLELQRRGVEARPILSTFVERTEVPAFQLEIFEAFGIERDDLEIVRGNDVVRIPELYTATQQFESPRWVDREITTSWKLLEAHLRRRAAESGESGLEAERIFISRRPGDKRNCVNSAEVEEYFRRRDFAIYFPEDHSYLHQVETFARAKKIAGFGGSGMFNMMFAPHADVLILTSDGYSARNELLLAAANGNDLTYVWGPAEQRPIKLGRHDRRSFRADFTIDLQAHRRVLRRFTCSRFAF